MYCKYLSKTMRMNFKCKKHKRHITCLDECKNCLDFILVRNKGIKKVSKKKIVVKKEIYDEVYKRDNGQCRLKDCTCNGELELHHIKYRSEAKNLINEPTNCIMLCNSHHRLVHSNKKMWQPILQEIIKKIYKIL